MRVSVRPNDPGYQNHCYLRSVGRKVFVKLNDEPVMLCVTADSHCGMVVRIASDQDGKPKYDRDRAAFVEEVLHGKVDIEVATEVCL